MLIKSLAGTQCRVMCLATAVMIAGCTAEADPENYGVENGDADTLEIPHPVDEIPSLETFPGTLSEGGAPEDTYARPPLAPVTPLNEEEIEALLRRLERLPEDESDVQEFALRPGSRPPPRTGETVLGEFPSPDELAPPALEAPEGPLQVLRFSPEGEVPLAGQVSVTFDRPMVDVTSHTDALEQWSAVIMTPWPLDGAWRWVGTRTLVFEPEGPRLPMATDYTVEIPAGAYAPDGAILDEAVQWTFSTPPPVLESIYPYGSGNILNPLIFILFDQRIDAQAMSNFIRLQGGGRSVPVRLASADEIADDEAVSRRVEHAAPDHWLVLHPQRELPYDSEIVVIVEAGAPSAEGPRVTGQVQSLKFQTHGPLIVTGHHCGWRKDHCAPDDWLRLTFSNSLAEGQRMEDLVEISPAVAGLEIQAWGNGISITGWKTPRTRYTVTLSPELTDQFGQKLSAERVFTFNVGSAPPQLAATQAAHLLLDPAAEPVFEFHSLNYADARIEARRVGPSDWPAYIEARRQVGRDGDFRAAMPGEQVFDERVAIEGGADEIARTAFDLQPFLNAAGLGHLILIVEAANPLPDVEAPRYPQRAIVWVQSTRIGLDSFTDADETLVWATDLLSGAPRAETEIRLPGSGQAAHTDEHGLARIALADASSSWLEARAGEDVAMLPGADYYPQDHWRHQASKDSPRWFVFDDRAIYRPGERVHLKGWVRVIENRKGGDIRLLAEPGTLSYEVFDSRNNSLGEGQADVGALGGFDLAFELPDTPNLGGARVELRLPHRDFADDAAYRHHFQIEEFRTPEFEVSVRVPEGPFFAGERIGITAAAQYYAGGPLPGAEVGWDFSATTAHYAPPNHTGWEFGIGFPRWWWWPPMTETVSEAFGGQTDAAGEHHLDIDFDRYEVPRPVTLTAHATVTDVNRQAWAATAHWLVHPARDYVGLKTESYFVERGQPLEIDVLVADVEGPTRSGRVVKVVAGRVKNTRWDEEAEIDYAQECDVTTDEQGLGRCVFETAVGGRWRITATVVDDAGRRNVTRITRWVSGGPLLPTSDRLEIERAELIPDADEYAPGDIARVLVTSPFENAEGLMLINRHGMVEQRRFRVDGTSATLEIPVRHDWLPNVQLQVTLLGQAPRGDDEDLALPPRPAIASGQLDIPVSTAERALGVEVTPQASKLAPGGQTEISVEIRDHAGRPVADAEVALVVVDEAILALTGYALSDPMEVFYTLRPGGTQSRHGRADLVLASLDVLQAQQEPVPPPAPAAQEKTMMPGERVMSAAAESADMAVMADFDGSPEAEAITIRTDFNPLAAFVPSLTTDGRGRAQAAIQLPDNLTRYRVMVVAAEGAARYGTGESALTARLPLMARPSPPRFLNFGDAFEFPVVLQNQTDEPLSVAVALDVANLELEAKGWRAEVPPNDRVEVRFPARTINAGTARFQIAAQAGSFTDAARGRLPVWTPATSEAFATYGVIDEGAMVQPVSAPTEVWPQFGQLEITASSTAVQSLTDAFIYLQNYPFECTEQVASRVLSVAALRDVLSAFEAEGLPEPEDIETGMSRDLELLTNRQNPDGGFALWRRGERSWPYVTLHVAHALVRARGKGYAVPAALWDSTWRHIRDIERYIPDHYGDWARRHIVAYSLYVRALGGDRDDARARALLAEVDDLSELSFESLGWLLGVLSPDSDSAREVAELRRYLGNRVTETAAGATFASAYSQPDGYLIMHSSRRADGIVLEALIDDQPDSDLIPKIVHALQAHRTRGRWGNTQENAFVLLALDKYFNRFEDQTPDFVARAWLGESFAGEHAFRGRTTERYHLDIPMSAVARDGGRHDLILDKDGAGRMYYRVGLRYAPRSLELEPAAHGFEVQRRYLAVDDEDDVKQRDDGVWEIRAGARVKIELDLVAPARRHHVALIDPLPAGLEAINPALAVSAPPGNDNGPPIPLRHSWWWAPWYEHQNLRDERAEAFASLLPGGVYSYSYYARATTPGEYVVPPARAEEMYEPETFGRSGTDRVVVVER